nr:hypothetical protein GCM10020063_010570 [Dactylosporangium thailandense]
MDTSMRRRNGLGRLVAHENSASDLVAFLFEVDPQPLLDLLHLGGGPYICQREVQAGKGKGRLDLVLRRQADGHPVAVLEMKGASDVHGDQLDRYNSWADNFEPAPRRLYCTPRRRRRDPAGAVAAAEPDHRLRRLADVR